MVARAVVAGFTLAFAARVWEHFLLTGRVTGLLLLASELLVAALTVVRRRAAAVDRGMRARLATGLSILGPLLVRPAGAPGGIEDVHTASLSACGLIVIVLGKLSLGRSFGLVPANRGVVCSGLYRLVRHPIYAGYLVTHVAFLSAHPTIWNAALLASADVALIVRALYEEWTLGADSNYVAYLARVRWRFLPGVF